jgi:hypothetical protein
MERKGKGEKEKESCAIDHVPNYTGAEVMDDDDQSRPDSKLQYHEHHVRTTPMTMTERTTFHIP